MYFIKVALISLVLVINKNSCAQPEDHTTEQNEVEKCSSDKKVCGTDGKTYNNICLLQKETGVKLAHEGDCTNGDKKQRQTAYRPDLILKSKIVNSTEESLQKKLVKHFNPTTGKWEYVIDILPTIVITPTFHHLQMTNDNQIPSSYNITNIKTSAAQQTVGAVNAPNQLDINNLPSTYSEKINDLSFLGKISGGMSPNRKLIIDNSQGPSDKKNSLISEIVGNVTNNFPRSESENRVFLPMKNETILSFETSVSHPNRSHSNVFPSQQTSQITGNKSPVYHLQTVVNKPKSFNRAFGPIKKKNNYIN
uniref:Putative kazal type serine protease inhibitor n=1 Tax=Panstrongylus lignarius TaxID=156445 RepID=A0A224XT11_9HEMI